MDFHHFGLSGSDLTTLIHALEDERRKREVHKREVQ
jgi:hypothetical protein